MAILAKQVVLIPMWHTTDFILYLILTVATFFPRLWCYYNKYFLEFLLYFHFLFFFSQRATMYPTIPSDQVRKGSSSIWNPKNASSLQKSPILPPHSLDSSRSDTPRTDSSEGDTTSMWKINFYKNWYNICTCFFCFLRFNSENKLVLW